MKTGSEDSTPMFHVHVYFKDGSNGFYQNITDSRIAKGALLLESIRDGHPKDYWGFPLINLTAFNVVDQPTRH